MATVIGQKSMNKIVSHLEGVGLAVHETAREIGGKAESRLATHRDTGAAEIEVERGDVDSYVSLVDEAAVSIEFGHKNAQTGRYVHGLYIVTGAAGLI